MKRLLNRIAGHRAFRLGLPITAASLLLATSPATAATSTPFTGTGYLVGVPVPGVFVTNGLGQVSLKGNVHVLMVQADDPHLTGRFQASMDLAYQADGTAILYGAAYHEVGTWDLTDPKAPKFTPTSGLWEMTYRGVAQADGSNEIKMTGNGIGGAIDGLRVECTATRAAGQAFDPAILYLASGTIRPAPVTTVGVIDNFDDNRLSGLWTRMSNNGQGTITETNQQFTVRGYWPGVHSASLYDSWAKGWVSKRWAVADGQTLEWRVDLVDMNESTSIVEPGAGSWSAMRAYVIGMGSNFVAIGKLAAGPAVLSCDRTTIKTTNVVLALALTRVQTNLVVTARVLDKDNHGAVLFERSVVDTPEVDPTLTTAEFEALTGMRLQWWKDVKEPPLFSGDAFNLEIFQYNDGSKPAAEVTFDNLELRTYAVPLVGVERAVRLTWPAPAGVNYAVEGAPTVQGPWLPVQDSALPGLQQMTVPANDIMKFFRLRQAP